MSQDVLLSTDNPVEATKYRRDTEILSHGIKEHMRISKKSSQFDDIVLAACKCSHSSHRSQSSAAE